jgi:hypothetical protein
MWGLVYDGTDAEDGYEVGRKVTVQGPNCAGRRTAQVRSDFRSETLSAANAPDVPWCPYCTVPLLVPRLLSYFYYASCGALVLPLAPTCFYLPTY